MKALFIALAISTILTNNEVLNLTNSNPTFKDVYNLTILDAFLYVDYVYLDNLERIKFAKSNHEYLIDVCQFDNDKIIFNSYLLILIFL